ncbi:MAG: anthranilate synthase component I [Candidatus Brocadiae bacterium]|nr:anthranilate synthase component I [Candidatus Brocadiia bacterium]
MTRTVAVPRDIPADLETPVSAFLKLRPAGARFLLESVEGGETLGRHSFIGVGHSATLTFGPTALTVERERGSESLPYGGRDPLHLLRDILGARELGDDARAWPLLGGAVGYLGYDFVRHFERIPATLPDRLGLPDGRFLMTDALVLFDHIRRKMTLVTLAESEAAGRERLEEMVARLRGPLPAAADERGAAGVLEPEMPREKFLAAVEAAREHIRAGDACQIVLSQRFSGALGVPPFQVYRALRILNPSPYMFYFESGDLQLIGSSPEVLVKLDGRTAILRPIAGTRPRGETEEKDRALAAELLADEKERAEHVMLVDLARNDLGRVCAYGTVKPTDLFSVERYSHVMHLVSEVRGTLRPGLDQFDLFRAAFPAGTVTGAPKVRAMQIIESLESSRRGPYAGAVGYFGANGSMDMCIAIRTLVVHRGVAHLQAGAGIVGGSTPEGEELETQNKVAVLRKAVELAADL